MSRPSYAKRQARIQEELTSLAELFPENGELLAQTMPADFLRMVADEIRRLRAVGTELRELAKELDALALIADPPPGAQPKYVPDYIDAFKARLTRALDALEAGR